MAIINLIFNFCYLWASEDLYKDDKAQDLVHERGK